MTWDYIQDDQEPQSLHRFARGKWETIDVELMMKVKIVELTRKEWKELKLFLERYEFSEIKEDFYKKLSDKVIEVIEDWLDYNENFKASYKRNQSLDI